MAKELKLDSSQEVMSADCDNSQHPEGICCSFCGSNADGCPNRLAHMVGMCPAHAFLYERIGISQTGTDEYTDKKRNYGEPMIEDKGTSNDDIHDADTEPIDSLPTSKEYDPYEMSYLPGEPAVSEDTVEFPETVLFTKLDALFDPKQITSFKEFLTKLKEAIDYYDSVKDNGESGARVRNITFHTINRKSDERDLKSGKTTIEVVSRQVTMESFIILYNILNEEWVNFFEKFAKYRKDGTMGDEDIEGVLKGFFLIKLTPPYKITGFHQIDLVSQNTEKKEVYPMGAWIKKLLCEAVLVDPKTLII